MNPSIEVFGRKIGSDYLPLVIAEVGINHEGDINKAKQCIDAAVEAGAECVKFQCHITDAEMIPTDMKPGKISDERLWDIIERCALTEDEEQQIKDYCDGKGILYLCTPFSREAADRLEGLGIDAYKIGSGECNNIPLITHIAEKKKPIILSTGMNDIHSIRKTVNIINTAGCPLMLMHCTSLYPTPYDRVRLACIQELQHEFGLPVGLSDHSIGVYTGLAAVALGACAIEKHFTVSRDWPGPDVGLSIEPHELAELVKGARAIFQALGGRKTILAEEQPVIEFAYASVVTIKPIRKGEKFTRQNTWVKRPGTGQIRAADFDGVLGCTATRDIDAQQQLKESDILDVP
ncbi:polyhydroxyalkanoate biosynthesis repressor PhaR [Candidatus Parcubacteria bacterium]|nr:MAG: polyhydroxyalkanoate biosynthesis repressor PhaR [Candidatus Parcubacteria bacterium]